MAYPSELARSLDHLDRQSSAATRPGDKLQTVLDRYLLEIERAAGGDMQTSILLLDNERKCLLHGAAPSLPTAYCEAIDGIAVGPSVGSCGTAAYMGHAIFDTDIATDSLWADFRELALSHDLKSCWSTPIRSANGEMIGTFAVYHSTARAPTEDEIFAIKGISSHVARAIARWN